MDGLRDALRGAARIGLFGGSFDPVHVGHLVLAEQAREQLALDRVLWVPAARNPHKARAAVAPGEERLAMLRLACEGQPAFLPSAIELEREEAGADPGRGTGPSPSYTVDTLEALHAAAPEAELYLLLGADALAGLPRWRSPERVLALARPAVMGRPGRAPELAALERALPGLSERLRRIEAPSLEISATDLRRRAAEGRSLRYLVRDAVAAHIAERGLYDRRADA